MHYPLSVRSEIACLVVTHQITEEAMPWLKRARDIFGRLVIFIDRARALPEAENRAKEVTSEVHLSDSLAFFASDFDAMVKACESDWVLFLDHDEELGPGWEDREWRTLLSGTDFTHFFFPRRWVLPNGNWIEAAPWWPDFQLRLFRSDAPKRYPTRPHEPLAVTGPAALLRHLPIHHHIWLSDLGARQQKIRLYESLLPGGALEYFYLYEQFHPREIPIPPPSGFDPQVDVVTMHRMDVGIAAGITLTGEGTPDHISRAHLFWVRTVIHNHTDIAISSGPSFPVRVSYHWRDALTGNIEIFEGLRSDIIDPIIPGERREMEIVVYSPPRPGAFLLELSLVQEQHAWFDDVIQPSRRTVAIQVT